MLQPHTIEWKPYRGHIWWEKLLNLAHFLQYKCNLPKWFNIEFQLSGMRTNLAFMDVIFANFIKITALRSNHPSEACEHYYFSPHTWTVSILVAENRSTPCPFSGSYRVDGQVNHMVDLFETNSLPKLLYEEIVEKRTRRRNHLKDV